MHAIFGTTDMHEIVGRLLLVYVMFVAWPAMVWITIKKWL